MAALRLKTNVEKQVFEAYVAALLASESEQQIFDGLADLDIPVPYKARIKIVASEYGIDEVIGELEDRDVIHPISESRISFRYSTTVGYNRESVTAYFSLLRVKGFTDTRDIRALVSVSDTTQWKVLKRLFTRQYPRLVPVLLSQRELVRSTRALEAATKYEVKVRAFSATGEVQSRDGVRKKSVREWTDTDLEKVLVELADLKLRLKNIRVDFFPSVGTVSQVVPKASCKISKEGELQVDGSFRLAFDNVAHEIAKIGSEKLEFLSGRGLRESRYRPRPLAISFKQSIFEDLETVRALVRVLKDYPHSMHAVQHGNPYAHVQLMDVYDNSSFDVWAVPPNRIVLTPGLKASTAGFERLVHYLYDQIREGTLENYV